jgi:hypothetical protein
MLRWWNGLGWSDARKAPDALTERARQAAAQAVRSSTVTPQQVARIAAARADLPAAQLATAGRAAATAASNPIAAAAVVLGILGLVVGFYGLLSVIGLIISVQGLVRSRRLAAQGASRTGVVPSLFGLLLAAVGLIRWIPEIVALVQSISAQVQG